MQDEVRGSQVFTVESQLPVTTYKVLLVKLFLSNYVFGLNLLLWQSNLTENLLLTALISLEYSIHLMVLSCCPTTVSWLELISKLFSLPSRQPDQTWIGSWKAQDNTGRWCAYLTRKVLLWTSYNLTFLSQDETKRNWLELGPNRTDEIPSSGASLSRNSLLLESPFECDMIILKFWFNVFFFVIFRWSKYKMSENWSKMPNYAPLQI